MVAATLLGSMKKVDFYRTIPKDLMEPTAPGVIISIAASLLMFSLFLGELWSYMSPKMRSDMRVGNDHSGHEQLKVNFDMSFYRLPCFAFSLDVVDVLGRHEVGIDGNYRHMRISHTGEELGIFDPKSNFREQINEGCRATGAVAINKVPGNFHVSAHGKQMEVMQYLNGQINVQHEIHYLWFGEVDFKSSGSKRDHDYEGQVHPLNGVKHIDPEHDHYEYFMDIVPTIYTDRFNKKTGKPESGYQFTANFHAQEVPDQQMPAAFFRYQLSPITVEYGPHQVTFTHFLTYMCAIVGGVFTVAGILSHTLHKTALQFQKRVLGKDA